MSAKSSRRTPSFRHHKATGQGFVELNGRRIYLGRFDRPETRQRYHQLVAEWIANGRQLGVHGGLEHFRVTCSERYEPRASASGLPPAP